MPAYLSEIGSLITRVGECVSHTSNVDSWREAIIATNFVSSPRLTPLENAHLFDARMDKVRVGGISMLRRRQSVRFLGETAGISRENIVVTLPLLAGAGHLVSGREGNDISSACGTVDDLNEATRLDTGAGADWITVILPRSRVEEAGSALVGGESKTKLKFRSRFEGKSLSWTRYLSAAVQGSEVAAHHPLVASNLEQLVLIGLLISHPHSLSDLLTTPTTAALPPKVRQAMIYMEERLDSPLTIGEVAAHVGVGVRSLQIGFRSHKGCTPKEWLRDRRLERAHIALQTGNMTVTQAAFTWGFGNLGQFAAHYRNRFGCNPSDTQRHIAGF